MSGNMGGLTLTTTSARDIVLKGGAKASNIFWQVGSSATIVQHDAALTGNCGWKMYNVLGEEVLHAALSEQSNTLATGNLPLGIYFYKVTSKGITVQSGRLVSKQ